MAQVRKVVGSTISLLVAGYVIGLLTAPRSGKNSRKLIKSRADKSIRELESQLKQMFAETQDLVKKIDAHSSSTLIKSKGALIKNQRKIKELLSLIHGNDAVDEDLVDAINEAKKGLKSFANYLSK